MSKALISTAKSVRQMVIHQVQSIPEELFDVQTPPFGNTIRWNAGHIVLTHEYFLSQVLPIHFNLPKKYVDLFATGTKPSEWTKTPPTKEELIQSLNKQLSRFSEISTAALEKELEPPMELGQLKFKTAGEVFNFSSIHETMHFTTISCLLKVLQHQKVN